MLQISQDEKERVLSAADTVFGAVAVVRATPRILRGRALRGIKKRYLASLVYPDNTWARIQSAKPTLTMSHLKVQNGRLVAISLDNKDLVTYATRTFIEGMQPSNPDSDDTTALGRDATIKGLTAVLASPSPLAHRLSLVLAAEAGGSRGIFRSLVETGLAIDRFKELDPPLKLVIPGVDSYFDRFITKGQPVLLPHNESVVGALEHTMARTFSS